MLKMLKKLGLIFLCLIAAGYLALICVYTLPTEPIRKHIAESSNIMQMEGSHPELIYGHQDTMLDNLTDSIMLLTARYEIQDNVFLEALRSNRETADGMMDSEILAAEAEGEALSLQPVGYGRYWHGYLVYLKPLLLMFNYAQIRYLIGFVQMALLGVVLYLMVKKQKETQIIPWMAAYCFMNPQTLMLSLQYLPASVLMMVQMIVLLICEKSYQKDRKKWITHFFVTGCLIAYFDLLTYPLVTLGIPLAFLLYENQKGWKEDLKNFISCCIAWGSGYVMMWAGKWILGSLLTGENVIMDALENILLRTGAVETAEKTSVIEVVVKNLGANKLGLLAVCVTALFMSAYGIAKYKRNVIRKLPIGMVLCVCLPFAWYVVISNHSAIHYWFTYRILAVSIYAGLLIVSELFCKEKKKELIN